jgi:hypothetical protein
LALPTNITLANSTDLLNSTALPTSTPIHTTANIGFLESLNIFLPYVVAIVVGIVAFFVFVWYRQKYMPEIARTFTKAYHSRGLACFLQDEMGNVALHVANKKLPEGVIFVPNKGWFLLPNPPKMPTFDEVVEYTTRKVGRPPKNPTEATENLKDLYMQRKKEYAEVHGILVQTPILKGFGRQVFFGSTVSVALSNLQGIAHADLPNVRLLAPTMYQKTQLDALATGNRLEGMKMAGKDMTKWIFAAIAGAIVIGALGLVVYLLTQHPAA